MQYVHVLSRECARTRTATLGPTIIIHGTCLFPGATLSTTSSNGTSCTCKQEIDYKLQTRRTQTYGVLSSRAAAEIKLQDECTRGRVLCA